MGKFLYLLKPLTSNKLNLDELWLDDYKIVKESSPRKIIIFWICIPWKLDPKCLGDSFTEVIKRFFYLERILLKKIHNYGRNTPNI